MINFDKLNKRFFSFWYLNSAGWFTLALIYLLLYYRNNISDLKTILGLSLTYIAGFMVSVILRFYYKWYRRRERGFGSTVIVVIASSVIGANIWYWLDVLISIPHLGLGAIIERITFNRYLSLIFSNSFVLFNWSVVYFVIKLWIEWSYQKARSEKATALAQQAQLQMLRYQLNPHFLFNSLNSIRALIDYDNKSAKMIVSELSEFLRYSLLSKKFSEVPLSQEIEAIKHYLTIEKIRFEDKLEIYFEIDPLAEEFPVLSFLLHPLIENAVKYGMKTSEMPLKIWVIGKISDSGLTVKIINSGSWYDGSEISGTGTGIENVKQRLENAFPGKYGFNILNENGKVSIELSINRKPLADGKET